MGDVQRLDVQGGAARTAIEVADWRRRVFDMYAEVRRMSIHDPREAHGYWREARDELFATHAQTPLPSATAR